MTTASRSRVALAIAVLLSVTLLSTHPPAHGAVAAFTSDDFSAAELHERWTVVDPVGDGSVSIEGSGTAGSHLNLTVPPGVGHDPWNTNRSLRVQQASADVDLQADLRFLSVPTLKYQMQGLVVEQDASNWLRFDVHSTGSALRLFAAKTVAGKSTSLGMLTVPAGPEVRLRVTRSGGAWQLQYSSDGSSYTHQLDVQHALTVRVIAPFAGNSGTNPAWTAKLDYVLDAASPVEQQFALATSVVGSGAVVRDPAAEAYAAGTVVSLSAVPAQGSRFVGWSGDATGSVSPVSVTMEADRAVTATFEPEPPLSGAAFHSDDFSSGSLDPAVWTIVDPQGDGTVSFPGAGTSDARVALAVPTGPSHDAYGVNRSLRATQPLADVDFDSEVRFLSVPSQRAQQQGLLVEQDLDDWLRFDVHHTGTALRVYAAKTTAGTTTTALVKSIASSSEVRLRVSRSGDAWALAWSPDGSAWNQVGSFLHGLTASRIGVFAGNDGKTAWTADVDWAFDLAAPIDPEDGTVVAQHVLSTEVVGNGTVTRSPSASAYPEGTVVDLTAAPALGWEFTGWTGDVVASGPSIQLVMNRPYDITATFASMGAGPPQIVVWYGDDQVFGARGKSQRFVNVLGNVQDADGIESFKYQLNGSSPRALKRGPDNRRLFAPGDFNVQIDYDILSSGVNEVTLTAVDTIGEVSTRVVAVHKDVRAAPLPHVADWQSSVNPNGTGQVVDGKWSVSERGLSTDELGYDRTVAIGDLAWKDYVVTVPIVVDGLGPDFGTPESGDPLVGLGIRWQGHSQRMAEDPYIGWFPTGAFVWERWTGDGRWEMQGNDGTPLVRTPFTWSFGQTYMVKVSATTLATGTRYESKVWLASAPEPADWMLSLIEDSGPAAGSVVLIAHHVDATFGDVLVEVP